MAPSRPRLANADEIVADGVAQRTGLRFTDCAGKTLSMQQFLH
jgi:hypothetical protein